MSVDFFFLYSAILTVQPHGSLLVVLMHNILGQTSIQFPVQRGSVLSPYQTKNAKDSLNPPEVSDQLYPWSGQ